MIRSAMQAQPRRRLAGPGARALRCAVLREVCGDQCALGGIEGTVGHAHSRIGCRCADIEQPCGKEQPPLAS
jgi:hypothetical protein